MATTTETKAFHLEMRNVYFSVQRVSGYRATRFLQLVDRIGGLEAAKRLLSAGDISNGLTELCLKGCLQHSMECLVLDKKWRHLFTDDQLATAQRRLEQLHYRVPA
ncbi:hypothetical protein [Zavarzinia aquatilis]|nr:hypothetical protein [Zavarzinia aquatilis]